MASPSTGVSSVERLEAILRNQEIYSLARLIPEPAASSGGRRRTYPDYMLFVYEALISVYESARRVEAELAHPLLWNFMRTIVAELFPDEPDMHLPVEPMRRHHYLYGRNRYLSDPDILPGITELHRRFAADQARVLGLMDPEGLGSWTHPHQDRIVHADGKVVTPLFRGKPGETRTDKVTGEIKTVRSDPDADLHFEGDGDTAYGTKFVLVAARTHDERGRIILDVEWVPDRGGEARVAVDCFSRLALLLPGAQGIVYDTALRGVHHQKILRQLGLIPINRVTAAVGRIKQPRRQGGRRVEKSAHIDDKRIRLCDGSTKTAHLYSHAGAVGLGELSDTGELLFRPLLRVRTHRLQDKNRLFRWYNDYLLPPEFDGKTVMVRLHGNEKDAARRFNRAENVRPIPPSDADFLRLFPRRNDSESINRGVVDSLYLGRAHSVGHARQHVNLIGYALMVNSLALHRGRARAPSEARAA
ncbi:MAG: hypothetical protein ABR529_00045 [Actinomycetota bacterium]